MCTGTHENDQAGLAGTGIREPVRQKKIAANMTFSVAAPLTAKSVVKPFRTKGMITGYQQQHRLFEAMHIVPAGSHKTLPVSEKGF